MTRRLPRAVVALLRRVVSPRVAADLLADLEEDYRRVRAARSPLVAGAWLAGETSSIVVASARGAVARIGDGAPRLARDARLAVRGLRQAPLATAVAVSTVALGLAGLLVAAGLDRSVLRRPVSAIHGDSLRRVGAVDGAGRVAHHFSFREVERIRDHLGDGARHAVANLQPAVVRVRGADVQTMVEVVDGRFFALTGHPILVGRGLVADDDRPAAPPVAVISDALWRRRYAAAPAVVGQRIEINRSSFTVVGVTAAPGAASALGAGVDVWTPLAHGDGVLSPGWRTDADARWFTVFALPVGSVAALDSQLARAASDLAGRDPERWRDRRLLSGPGTLLGGQQRRAARALVALLAALALLVVGAGAANLAGVLMARAAVTARHTAIHLALGAGPWALARRILLEGAMLGGAAGMLAVVVHRGARSWLSEISLLPTLSLRIDVPLDVGDGIAVVIAAVAAGAAVALMPASGALRAGVQASLSRSAWSAGDPTTSRARRLLVAGQSGVSLILVIGAVLFLRTTAALGTVDLGFPRDGLVALDFDLAPAVAPAEAAVLAREAVDRVAARPGVTGVAMASRAPVDRSLPVVAVGRDRDDRAAGAAALSLVTEGYFRTVGIPLVAGRAFSRLEAERDDPVAVVDETLARRLWAGQDAVGREVVVGAERQRLRVVGVARDVRQVSVLEASAGHVYRPVVPGFALALLVRTSAEPRRALVEIQRTLDEVGPGVVGFFPRTLDDHLATELLPARLAAAVSSGLGVVALVLSGCGLYGLVAWLVERRRRELAVRLALGASPAAIGRLVIGQAMRMAAPGAIVGMLGAAALAVGARSQLFGVAPLDPVAFGAGALVLAGAVVVAAWIPSARAARIDPAVTLRDT